jgi:VCBS repeat protein
MPSPSARWVRRASAVSIVCGALLLAACSSGGSGGDSAVMSASGPSASATSTNVTLAWSPADGPVNGYSVFVQRDGMGGFDHEQDVAAPQVVLSGEPGHQARVIVAAFDASHMHGPSSPPSPTITFPGVQTAAAASAPPASSAASSATGASSTAGDAAKSTASDAKSDPAPIALAGALVWQSGDSMRVTDAALATELQFTRPAGAALVAVSDFDADGLADLLWVGISESGARTVGFTPSTALREGETAPVVALGELGEGERVLGAGDFDGDGHADVLVASADSVHAWLVGPDAAHGVSELGTTGAASFVGIGDFDATGTEDVAWRTAEGVIVLWLMDGGQAHSSVEVALDAGLDAIATGDFDGDGAAELAVRDAQGAVFRLQPLAAQAALEATDLAGAQDWRAVGAADLDRDGNDELVLAGAQAIRIAGMPGDEVVSLSDADWQLVALIP